MGHVIELQSWVRRREAVGRGDGALPAAVVEGTPVEGTPVEVARLERAVARLEPLLDGMGAHPAGLGIDVETELLALSGAVSLGMYDDAARRAERLVERLTARRRGRG